MLLRKVADQLECIARGKQGSPDFRRPAADKEYQYGHVKRDEPDQLGGGDNYSPFLPSTQMPAGLVAGDTGLLADV